MRQWQIGMGIHKAGYGVLAATGLVGIISWAWHFHLSWWFAIPALIGGWVLVFLGLAIADGDPEVK